jgi:hypothetical protein
MLLKGGGLRTGQQAWTIPPVVAPFRTQQRVTARRTAHRMDLEKVKQKKENVHTELHEKFSRTETMLRLLTTEETRSRSPRRRKHEMNLPAS